MRLSRVERRAAPKPARVPSGEGLHFGPNPWQQTSWDARAAGNFIGGGAGGGLIVATAWAQVQGRTQSVMLMVGLTLIGLGLACVWAEIGRPLRALHVFINPRTSWMSREAIVGTCLMAVGAATALFWPEGLWLAAALAIAFVYCQSRMLQAARGIPAWREPMSSPLIVATGLVEGMGLWVAATPLHGVRSAAMLGVLAVLLMLRAGVWLVYRHRLGRRAAPRANEALDGAGRWLLAAGSALPLALLALWLVAASTWSVAPLEALAGLLAWGTGAWMKFVLVTRAAFNQGFALAHLPVRGVRA